MSVWNTPGFGQDLVNVNLTQPDVWTLPGIPESGVGSDGDLNLTIPIMTVPGRGLNYDIAFSYNSSITIDRTASWIGLGWSFDPGSISREVEGGGYGDASGTEEYYGVDLFDHSSLPKKQPDVYYINVPGRGTLQATEALSGVTGYTTLPPIDAGDFTTINHRSWKITPHPHTGVFSSCDIDLGVSGTCEGSTIKTTQTDYRKFTVTTEDGIRYIYEAPTLSVFTTGKVYRVLNGESQADSYQRYVSTWRLKAILGTNYVGDTIPDPVSNPNGEWILFNYTGVGHAQMDVDYHHFKEARYLKEIITPTHKAEFILGDREEENFPVSSVSSVNVHDIYRSLDKINLINRTTDESVQSVDFTTGLTFGPDEQNNRRLGLSSISFTDGDTNPRELSKYSFEYACDAYFDLSSAIPNPQTEDFGHINPSYDPPDKITNCPSANLADAWRLTKITYPTGGSEEYEYEFDEIYWDMSTSHYPSYKQTIHATYATPPTSTETTEYFEPVPQVSPANVNYGGSRIKNIEQVSNIASPIITEYTYGNGYPSGIPSGLLPGVGAGAPRKLFVHSSRGQVKVFYSQVKRTVKDLGAPNQTNGYTEIHYTTPENSTDAIPIGTSVDLYADGGGKPAGIIVGQNNNDMYWGRIIKEVIASDEIISGNPELIQVTEYELNDLSGIISDDIWPNSSAVLHLSHFRLRTDAVEVRTCPNDATTEIECTADNGNDGVVARTENTYNNQTNQIEKVTRTASNVEYGNITTTKFAYEEYDGQGDEEMVEMNMLSQVYSTTISECTTNPCNTFINDRSKSWTLYANYEDEPSDPDIWRATSQHEWSPANIGASSAPAAPGTGTILVNTIDEFDDHGNPVRISSANNIPTSIKWDSNGFLPKWIGTNLADPDDAFVETFDVDTPNANTLENCSTFDNTDDGRPMGKTEWSVVDGRLELLHHGLAVNNEFDHIECNLNKSHFDKIVLEFDLTLDQSNNWDFLVVLASSSGVPSVWLAIKNLDMRYFVSGSGWTQIKSGLEMGKTYHIKVVVDPDTTGVGTTDYYVDGEKLISSGNSYTGAESISQVQFRNYGYATDTSRWFVDNVRVYPEGALLTSSAYDPDTYNTITLTGPNGISNDYYYDTFGRLKESRDQNDIPFSQNSYFIKNQSVSPTFDDTATNFTSSISYADTDGYTQGAQNNNWTVIGSNITFGVPYKGRPTVYMATDGSYPDYLLYNNNNKDKNLVARVDFLASEYTNGYPHLITMEDYPDNENACYIRYNADGASNKRFEFWEYHAPTVPPTPYIFDIIAEYGKWYTVELEKREDGSCRGWVYPKGHGRIYDDMFMFVSTGYPHDWVPRIRSSMYAETTSPYYLADFYVGPVIETKTYADGLGRTVQSQTLNDHEVVVNHTSYDATGRRNLEWVPFSASIDDVTFAFNNSAELTGAGSAQDYFNTQNIEDNSRPYSETLFEDAPLSRPFNFLAPGISDTTNSIRTIYRTGLLDTSNDPVSAGTFAYIQVQDQDEKKVREFSDAFGNTVQTISGVGSSAAAVTNFTYDPLSRLIKVKDPSGNDTYYRYNHRSQIVGKITPNTSTDVDDANYSPDDPDDEDESIFDIVYGFGEYGYRYDHAGNLRFIRDPKRFEASPAEYIYYVYDEHNRIIQEGIYSGNTAFSGAPVDTRDWPSTQTNDINIEVSYIYEGPQLVEINADSVGSYFYTYDEYNRIKTIEVSFVDVTPSRTINYEYDLLGRTKKMIFNDAYYFWYEYDDVGRLSGVYSNTTNNYSTATREAVYDYTPADQIDNLLLGDDPTGTPLAVQSLDYTYNIRSFLTSINDPANLTDSNSLEGDAFGTSIGYDTSTSVGTLTGATFHNGNIAWMSWATRGNDYQSDLVGYAYTYDDLNRLEKANWSYYTGSSWASSASNYDVGAGSGIVYHKNGDLKTLYRVDEYGVGTNMKYKYDNGGSWLTSVNNTDYTTISYDLNGNILSTGNAGLLGAKYDYRNLPKNMTFDGNPNNFDYYYSYDGSGNRVIADFGTGNKTYFILGPAGETVAAYDDAGTLKYVNIISGSEVIGRIMP